MTTASMITASSITTRPPMRRSSGAMSTVEIKARIEAMLADDRRPDRQTGPRGHHEGDTNECAASAGLADHRMRCRPGDAHRRTVPLSSLNSGTVTGNWRHLGVAVAAGISRSRSAVGPCTEGAVVRSPGRVC